MRLSLAIKTFLFLSVALAPGLALAQQSTMPQAQQQAINNAADAQATAATAALQKMMQSLTPNGQSIIENAHPEVGQQQPYGRDFHAGSTFGQNGDDRMAGGMPGQLPAMTQQEWDEKLKDTDSPQAHAEMLAKRAKSQRNLEKNLNVPVEGESELPPPPDMFLLQDLGDEEAKTTDELGNPVKDEQKAAIDMRREAQKEAALSYGARGGLARGNYDIMQKLKAFETTLDRVFNFRALLIKAPSGLMVEPPIVRESLDSLVITNDGGDAAVADKILNINKQAKIVSAPRDWRQYLIQTWTSDVPPPPKILWPKTSAEKREWRLWVSEGWKAGARQADDMFQSNLARLSSDYNGMVRYRMLLTQGMISQPYTLQEDRGVTGTKTVMRVGDRALRITGPSQFLTGSDLWKPADR